MQSNEAQPVAQALAEASSAVPPVSHRLAQVVAQAGSGDADDGGGSANGPVAFCGDASLRFANRIVRDHGRRRADGLVQVDRSVRELAQDHGLSPGTVQSRLRELDAHGVRCSARPTVIDPARLDELLSPAESTTPARQPGPRRRGLDLGPHDSQVDDQTSRLLSLAAQLTAADPSMLDLAAEIAQRALTSLAEARAGRARAGRAVSRDQPRETARPVSEVMDEMDEPHSSVPPSSEQHGPRARPAAREPRGSRGDDELLDLVAPLATVCDELGLPGVTNLAGLRDALDPFCDETVAAAVQRLACEARAGLRTPMGKLVNTARARDRSYFSPARLRPLGSRPGTRAPSELEWTGPASELEPASAAAGHDESEAIAVLPSADEVNRRVATIRQGLSQTAKPSATL